MRSTFALADVSVHHFLLEKGVQGILIKLTLKLLGLTGCLLFLGIPVILIAVCFLNKDILSAVGVSVGYLLMIIPSLYVWLRKNHKMRLQQKYKL